MKFFHRVTSRRRTSHQHKGSRYIVPPQGPAHKAQTPRASHQITTKSRDSSRALVFSLLTIAVFCTASDPSFAITKPHKTAIKRTKKPVVADAKKAKADADSSPDSDVSSNAENAEIEEDGTKVSSVSSEYNLSNFPTTLAKQAILLDFNSGQILFAKKADEPTSPSSMTKIVTACLVFSRMRFGGLTLDTEFNVSPKAFRKEGSSMFLKLGQRVSVEQLLFGLIIQSGNDAAVTLAEGICGTEEDFAVEMTSYARSIGATNTNFKNASGLPDAQHKTTVRDLATIACHAITTYPEFYEWYSRKEFTFNDIRQFSKNALLSENIGCDGIKTGKTDDGGYGIVASVKNGERRLILVVNGYKSEKDRKEDAMALLSWGLKTFTNRRLYKANEVIAQIPVWYGAESYLPITVEEELVITLPRFAEKDFKVLVYYDTPISAPIKKGERVGQVHITSSSLKMPIVVPLVASVSIREAGFFKKVYDSLLYLIWGMRAPEL
ncbi:MAG: D-alanyl-D-alanine carboxypeptidase [Holosporales bacterium]|nr:D-alanyl-D-alanine carboxypeptidase [Holosporales bacterium]